MLRQIAILIATTAALSGCIRRSSAPENSIQYPLRINLKSLDPSQASDAAISEVLPNMFEGLLQYHYLKRPLTVIPSLADGMPQVSKDGLTHTFKIKSGVHFHDSEVFPEGKGREVTADDFVYSFKRVADRKTQSDGFWIFDGKIVGLNEWREKLAKGEAKFDDPVEGLQAPDAHTLVIKLKAPYYQLYYVLTMGYAAVVPREAVEKYGVEFMNHPVGTGPYVFESWIRGNKVVLTRNPNWHGETYPTEGEEGDKEKGLLVDAGKPLPFVDKLVFHEIPEDQPRWLNFMKGSVDLAEIPKDNYDAAIENKTQLKPNLVMRGAQLSIFPGGDITYLAFNMADPLLSKNVNLRRALAMAFDTQMMIEKFYNNRAIAAHSPILPGMESYDPEFKNPWNEYNIDKAKALLAKAGFPGGKGLPPLEYSINASTTANQMSEFVQQQFAKIGVKVTILANSWPQFQDRIRHKKAQLFGIAWIADYPDPQNMFQLLYGKNVSPGPNSANYENQEFDALYEQALKLPPGPTRAKVYQKMRDIFADQMPWIPQAHRLGYMVYQGWVKNFKKDVIVKGGYKYMRVDLDKKRELKGNK
jgi:oligopeptide transport system substrate-binding protein